MLQVLLALIQYLAIAIFSVLALVFGIIAVVRRRRKRPFRTQALIAVPALALALALLSIDLFSSETTDREEGVEAFRSNFGFDPPPTVKEIKLKNISIYDAVGHWMAFTYEQRVFEEIVADDQPLEVALAGTPEFDAIVRDAYVKNRNRPDWAVLPTGRTRMIHHKKDFMQHSYSAYYLWEDTVDAMVHLHVTYFD